ncbi:MAG: Fe-S cluster assembly protein SufD [Myxococcales bacterium]|nr:Fe-S cluster assembly protein SufD [Myxococcales bacterium]
MSYDPIQHYKDAFAKRPQQGEPAWLHTLRQAALERFCELGFPTRKHEEWKYTPIRPISSVPFAFSDAPAAISETALEAALAGSQDTLRVVFVEGHLAPSLSSMDASVEGLSLRSIQAALQDAKEDSTLRKQLALAADRIGDNPFDALNLAFFTDGVVVDVAKNAVVSKPLEIVYVGRRGVSPYLGALRSLISAERSSQLTVVERFVGLDEAGYVEGEGKDAYFTNASTSFFVEENASVGHYKIQQDSNTAFHMAFTSIHQKSNSRASSLAVSLGAQIARNEIEALLDGQGIETTLNGLYLVDGERFVDNRTFLDHAKPHCNSFEVYKGILSDRGKGTFNGKILVRQDAQKTDAKQSNQALLLSDDATIYSKPQLEIFADDVKCTHGATTGYLDKKSMFYAQSRGVPEEVARGLLTYAFANELIHDIQLPALRDELNRLLAERFQLPAAAEMEDWSLDAVE